MLQTSGWRGGGDKLAQRICYHKDTLSAHNSIFSLVCCTTSPCREISANSPSGSSTSILGKSLQSLPGCVGTQFIQAWFKALWGLLMWRPSAIFALMYTTPPILPMNSTGSKVRAPINLFWIRISSPNSRNFFRPSSPWLSTPFRKPVMF